MGETALEAAVAMVFGDGRIPPLCPPKADETRWRSLASALISQHVREPIVPHRFLPFLLKNQNVLKEKGSHVKYSIPNQSSDRRKGKKCGKMWGLQGGYGGETQDGGGHGMSGRHGGRPWGLMSIMGIHAYDEHA